MAQYSEKSSTPSLVGLSVRDINDDANDTAPLRPSFLDMKSRSQSLGRIPLSTNTPDQRYRSVDELTREGALLTDEIEVDLDQVSKGDQYVVQPSLLEKSGNARRIKGPKGKRGGMLHASHSHDNVISNSYGDVIINQSQRPHLAQGESYQSVKSDEDDLVDEEGARVGRSFQRASESSREFIRSLSRSLTRDQKSRQSTAATSTTTNYSISLAQRELDSTTSGPNIIEEEAQEEKEGVLLDDEGNEEHSEDLERAANEVL